MNGVQAVNTYVRFLIKHWFIVVKFYESQFEKWQKCDKRDFKKYFQVDRNVSEKSDDAPQNPSW